jgi:hypothetical protein
VKHKWLIVLGLVSLMIITSVCAGLEMTTKDKPVSFKGEEFQIVSDRWEYNQKNSEICYNVTSLDKNLKSNKKSNSFLVGLPYDKNKGLVDNKVLNFNQSTLNNRICQPYSYPIGYYSKFDIVAGDDILDPVINVTNPYNQTCSATDTQIYYEGTLTTYKDIYLPTSTNHEGLLLSKQIYLFYDYAGWTYSTKFYFVNGSDTTISHGAVGVGGYSSHTDILSYTNPVYRIEYSCTGASCNFDENYLYDKCQHNFTDNYYLEGNAFFDTVRFNLSTGCSYENVKTSYDNITFSSIPSNLTYRMTQPKQNLYIGINQTNCSWVLMNFTNATNGVLINIYDITNGSAITQPITLTFSSSNGYYLSETTTSGMYLFYGTSNASYTILISGTSYLPSQYIINYNTNTRSTLDAYLTKNYTYSHIFTIRDSQSLDYIENAQVDVYRTINNSLRLNQNLLSDITGRTFFYYEPFVYYTFIINKTGYDLKYFSFNSILFDSTTILLTPSSTQQNEQQFSEVVIVPSPTTFDSGRLYNFSLTFFSPTSRFVNYGYLFRFLGYSNTSSGNTATGQTFTINFSTIGATSSDTVNLSVWYLDLDGSNDSYNYTFEIVDTSNTSVSSRINGYGMGTVEKALTLTALTIFFAGSGALISGTLGAIFMGIFCLILWFTTGFITIGFIALPMIFLFIMLMIKLGGS